MSRPIWLRSTVAEVVQETETARSLVLEVPDWSDHIAGQHLDLRLTAPDGYQAARSYSISSGPGEPPQITVERVGDGEVSPYLVGVAEPGDQMEVRGPLGGYFIWKGGAQPLLLIGGGSGIAPLRAMWRAGSEGGVTVVYSARTAERVIFADELAADDSIQKRIYLTRASDPRYLEGRIDRPALESTLDDVGELPAIFVCGPTAFVEYVATILVDMLGVDFPIRTERFG